MRKRCYWLMKSEPDAFSIEDLQKSKKQITKWEGVRNYQARNFMRDEMNPGDGVFFYHSNAKPLAIVGTMNVVSESYADPSQFNPKSNYFDPTSNAENPRWMLVDVKLTQIFPQPVLREDLINHPDLQNMLLLKKGSRLSIQPVTEREWNVIHKLAAIDPK